MQNEKGFHEAMDAYLGFEINKKKVIKDFLNLNKINGILINNTINRFWYTNFSSTAGYLLITHKYTILYLDGRYITAGTQSAQCVDEVKKIPTNAQAAFVDILANDIAKLNITRIGFDENFFTYAQYKKLEKICPEFVNVDLSAIRAIKSNEEITNLIKSCSIAEAGLSATLPQITAGMTELQIKKILEGEILKLGADKMGFDTIIASGLRGALPHGLASEKIINNNELITIDFGCVYKGMCSDITRTVVLGNPSDKMQEIFNVVFEAQRKGVAAIKAGVNGSFIDKICRDHIIAAGYEKYFSHSTGHGLGYEVHEYPRVSAYHDVILKPGMVITVEPGIYIPGVGGVRIEDDILVTENGYQSLSTYPRITADKKIVPCGSA